jgi:2-dehydro-3-deoxyphosphooctonate aldolase (KDO 8-P synthase)
LKGLFVNQVYHENNFFLIAGPCVVESEEMIMENADKVPIICKKPGIICIYSFLRKANRTSSFTGIGDETFLALVKKAGDKYKLPTTPDVHAD